MESEDRRKVGLDELASGRLPQRILDEISEMQLTVDEVIEWESSRPKVWLVVSGDELVVRTANRIPIKKLLKILGGASGAGGVLAFVQWIL